MKIAFICVNYNNSKITLAYIESVLGLSTKEEIHIVVVDNASRPEELSILKSFHHPQLTVIYQNENLGYFKGLNKGIDAINAKEFDYVLIGNNDLTFEADFLKQLEAETFAQDVLVLAPNIIRIDGIHQNPHILNKFSKVQRIYRRLYYSHYWVAVNLQKLYNVLKPGLVAEDRAGHDIRQEILMGYGACYILTPQFFNHFERLDAPVFLMGEEGVLANQVLGVSGKTLYLPNLVVHHHDHASIGTVPTRKLYEFSRQSYQHYLRNLKNIQ
ncbi:MAG: glycosyltransferase family 2 protein [Pedobacter sp.]|nr:MAG: glycosyltransferase family 2 protein [Pedobacter sp.]